MRAKQLALAATVAAVAAGLGALAPSGATGAGSCNPATNVEAIIDDSGSMAGTDTNKLRVQGLKLLMAKSDTQKLRLGAVEFGDTVDTVFAPQLIAGIAAAMGAALDAKVDADNGTTDYNIAFQQAKADNPNADARIFLTDGGHNVGPYNNGHTPGPPTYVIGLGSFMLPADQQRLQQIANDTGGNYQQVNDSSGIQAAINTVDAYLHCQTAPLQYSDTFNTIGQSKSHSAKVSSKVKSADLVLTWSSPLDQFTIGSIKLQTRNGTIASVSRRHLRIKRTAGSTFLSVHIRGLHKGKLKFKLKLLKHGDTTTPTGVNLTTQLSRNAHS